MMTEGTAKINQFLTFVLDTEIYAFEISRVREVLDSGEVTRIPKMPHFMRGVINLRGNVVPVIDLRLKFGLKETEQTVNTCIIIIEILLDDETTILGAMADSVQEVLNLEADQIESAPKIGTHLNTAFIRGMGKKDKEFVIILNVDNVFSSEEIALVQDIESEVASTAAPDHTAQGVNIRV